MNPQLDNLKIAIVYDRINKFGGAERVLLSLHEIFPDAPLYTSVSDLKKAPWAKVFPKIHNSFLQQIPILNKYHELLGWLTPLAFESFNFCDYDLVISVTSEAAKGIITGTNTFHYCYMLTPTRYIWSGKDFYLSNPPRIFKIFPFFKFVSWPFIKYVKWWDEIAAKRPDKIIAISTEVKKRIDKYYGLNVDIVFPPTTDLLVSNKVSNKKKEIKSKNYYFIHGRFEPYKRLDLVIETFLELGYPLVVSGSGSEFNRYKNNNYKNIKFVIRPNDQQLIKLFEGAKAFLMPQDEDFGITSLEAQSFGIPVIAYQSGGALDTVVDGKTGVFFKQQNKASLIKAIAKFDTISFNRRYLVANAKKFSKEIFKRQLQRSLVRSYLGWRGRYQTLAEIKK